MNITHYFLHRSHANNSKNKLQKEIHDYLDSLNGKMIDAVDIKDCAKLIEQEIDKINKMHKKCKPVNVRVVYSNYNKGYMISGLDSMTFIIYPATIAHMSTISWNSLSNN
jgi:hypothetical protein